MILLKTRRILSHQAADSRGKDRRPRLIGCPASKKLQRRTTDPPLAWPHPTTGLELGVPRRFVLEDLPVRDILAAADDRLGTGDRLQFRSKLKRFRK